MFQLEIYEYNPKISEIYHNFYQKIEHINNDEDEKKINKEIIFQKIKNLNHKFLCRYIDLMKEDSKTNI
jgi:hypothetical protein